MRRPMGLRRRDTILRFEIGLGCGFHADSDTHSTHIRTVDSTLIRTLISTSMPDNRFPTAIRDTFHGRGSYAGLNLTIIDLFFEAKGVIVESVYHA